MALPAPPPGDGSSLGPSLLAPQAGPLAGRLLLGLSPCWFPPTQVVFEKGGVYLHTSAKKYQDRDSLIAGVIRVVEKVRWEGAGLEPAPSGMEALWDASGNCRSLVWRSAVGPEEGWGWELE